MPKNSPVRRTPAMKNQPAAKAPTVLPAATPTAAAVPSPAPAPVAVATPAPAFPAELVDALRGPAVEAAVEAAAALAKLGDARVVPALISVLENGDGYCHVVTRAAAAMALGRLNTPESAAALLAAARDPMAEVSKESILALGELKAQASAGLLTEIVANASGFYLTTTRHAAVRSLGRLRAASAKAVLTALAASSSEDPALTAAARDAIEQM